MTSILTPGLLNKPVFERELMVEFHDMFYISKLSGQSNQWQIEFMDKYFIFIVTTIETLSSLPWYQFSL